MSWIDKILPSGVRKQAGDPTSSSVPEGLVEEMSQVRGGSLFAGCAAQRRRLPEM